MRILLDRRILDWTVGLDSEINELVEGSDLYEPKVNLAQVVLPPGHLQSLLSQCLAYESFRSYRSKNGLGIEEPIRQFTSTIKSIRR